MHACIQVTHVCMQTHTKLACLACCTLFTHFYVELDAYLYSSYVVTYADKAL